jgi:hypothetical protein
MKLVVQSRPEDQPNSGHDRLPVAARSANAIPRLGSLRDGPTSAQRSQTRRRAPERENPEIAGNVPTATILERFGSRTVVCQRSLAPMAAGENLNGRRRAPFGGH